jgi:hypothetical protein
MKIFLNVCVDSINQFVSLWLVEQLCRGPDLAGGCPQPGTLEIAAIFLRHQLIPVNTYKISSHYFIAFR